MERTFRVLVPFGLLALAAVSSAQTGNPQPVKGKRGMVVSDEALASEAGAEMLRKGGNAVDAAVATGFALAVVQPAAGNIGGGGFMLVRMADGRTVFLDYREVAPKAASRNMYLDGKGEPVPGASLFGLKAAGVPGSVMGMHEAHRRFGRLPWRQVVEPSVRLARGFRVSATLANALMGSREDLEKFPESKRVYLRGGNLYKAGETMRLPDLARTLTRIQQRGADGFYRGETARLIAQDMRQRGGLITEQDLADYRVRLREPLKGSYRGHEILTAPPPSSGGAVMLQMMNVLEVYPMPRAEYGSARRTHLMIEAMKLAFADRAEYFGDPEFVQVPTEKLIDKAYATDQRRRIDATKATPSATIKPGLSRPRESDHTTHYSVVDSDGNAVSCTTTLNMSFGSTDTVRGTGILMNNEMDDFAVKPGTPNGFGLVQGERNAIQPGKRPLSSMTPTIVLRDGKPFLVVGSPGGPTIINTVMEVILNVIDYGMDVQQAVNAPRFHHQWLPDVTRFERYGLSPDTLSILRSMGHKLEERGTQGIAHCIAIDPKTGVRKGAADRRYPDARAIGQ